MTTDTANWAAAIAEEIVSASANVGLQVDSDSQTALLEQPRRDAAAGLALRTFRVDPYAGPLGRGALLPVVGTDAAAWGPSGYGLAECGRGRDHLAPDADCSCGIHGTTDLNALIADHPLLASNIVAVIDSDPRYSYWDGHTIRTMSGRVLAYWCHPSPRLDGARRVLAATDAEEFTDRDEMIADYLGTQAPRPESVPPLSRTWWRDVLAASATYAVVLPTLRQVFAVVGDAVKYALVPSLLANGLAAVGHAAARPLPGRVAELQRAAQQFVTVGRYLFGWLIETGIPAALLVVLLALGAARAVLSSLGYPGQGLLSGVVRVGANIIRCSGPLILPVFFFLCMLARAGHLPRSMVLDGTAVLAYVAYFGVTFGPTAADAAMRLWRQWRPIGAWSRATRTEVG